MANTTKTYRIEIEMSAARQALDDANKKLAALDKQLEGLDSGSDAAKKITADMAKLVGEIERLEQSTESFAAKLDSLKPGTIPALEQEIEELEASLRKATRGTEEFDAALLRLGNAKAELKGIEDQIDAIADTKQHAGALLDFANGLTGAAAIVTAANQALGLGSQAAEEYEQKLLGLISVMQGVESVSKALNGETLAVVKSSLSAAKGWLGFGEAAQAGSKAARVALASTGIGLILVLLGTLIGSWDTLTSKVRGSAEFFAKVKAVASGFLDAFIAQVKNAAAVAGKIFDGDFSGAAAKARNVGKEMGAAFSKGYEESLFEGYKKTIEQQVTYNEQILKIQQASGRDTFALQRRILQDKYILLDKSAADYKKQATELAGDLAALDRTEEVKRKKAALDAAQARLDGVAALEAAKGNDAFRQQLSAAKKRVATLQNAAQPDQAAITNQLNAIALLEETHKQQLYDKQRAALLARQQAELALLEAQGQYTLDLKVQQAQELLALDTGTSEKALEQKKADNAALQLLLTQQAEFEKELRQKSFEDREAQRGVEIEQTNSFNAVIKDAGKGMAQTATDLEKSIRNDLGRTLLTKLFGVQPEDVEAVKQALTQSVSEVYASLQSLAGAYVDGALQEADRQVQAAQDRLSQLDQQLNDSRSAAEQTTQQLQGADGARRDYLLARLAKEKTETERLAAAKAKAAAEEKKQTEEKHRLEKISQELAAATALATNIAAAASAVYAGIKAVEKGVEVGFPANLIAIAASIAAVIASVASAKQLGNSLKMADGGVIQGGSHASGNDVPVFGGRVRVEGGEMITPVDATRHNYGALELIRTQGRRRSLGLADFAGLFQGMAYEVIPPPAGYYPGHYANGGVLPNGPAAETPAGGYASAAELTALRGEQQRTNTLLERMLQHTARTADASDFLAERPPIVPDHETALAYDKKLKDVQASRDMAKL